MDDPAARLVALLEAVAWSQRSCRFCDAHLYLVRVNGGSSVAFTRAGINHLTDCPRYTQPPPGTQERLFGATPAADGFEPKR